MKASYSPSSGASRFAPSPTGYLHRGHAFSALTAARVAQDAGGDFVVRIEDIDAERCRPGFEAAIFEDLAWLGLSWRTPARRQSEHLTDYVAALEQLRERGLVYRCFKTRAEVLSDIGAAPHDAAAAFIGARLSESEEQDRLEAGALYAWRLSLAAAREALGKDWGELDFVEYGAGPDGERGLQRARPEVSGDIILARKGLGVAYHLAVVVDDAKQMIGHVVRGADLFEAVHSQRLLQALLVLPTPAYHHHRLLVGPNGKRLAKRDQAQTLRALRAGGFSAAALKAELGFS